MAPGSHIKAHLKTRKDKCNSLNRPVFSPDQQARQSKCESQDQVSHHNIAATIVRGWCESVMLKMIDRGPEMLSSRFGCDHDVIAAVAPLSRQDVVAQNDQSGSRHQMRRSPIDHGKKIAETGPCRRSDPGFGLESVVSAPANGSPGSPAVRQSSTSCRCNRRHHTSPRLGDGLQAEKTPIALSAKSGIVVQSDRHSAFGASGLGIHHDVVVLRSHPSQQHPGPDPARFMGIPSGRPGSLIGGDHGACDTWREPRAPGGRRDSAV